ncbi:MAG: DUF420 domain-containing protein [Flavobacteriales bacterium]|nr:DUF420 domain-containing protein [Flavobacteriales bacterium]
MSEAIVKSEQKFKMWITILSIAIPVAVAVLFKVNLREMGLDVAPLTFLPPIYAGINGLTAVLLIAAVFSIKKGNRKRHESLMKLSLVCSSLFLVMYVAYHMTADSTPYGGGGFMKYLYYFILVSHIILSVSIIPFVLVTYTRALLGKFPEHKKIAKIAFPLWLYVAVTGVVVYLMISPYYG